MSNGNDTYVVSIRDIEGIVHNISMNKEGVSKLLEDLRCMSDSFTNNLFYRLTPDTCVSYETAKARLTIDIGLDTQRFEVSFTEWVDIVIDLFWAIEKGASKQHITSGGDVAYIEPVNNRTARLTLDTSVLYFSRGLVLKMRDGLS